jgi:hypothetical protein
MSSDARKALAAHLKSLEGEELVVNLRFLGPVQITQNAFGNGPVALQGAMVRVSDDQLLTLRGTATQTGLGDVARDQTVLIEDILTVNQIGSVVKRQSSFLAP